MKVLVPVKRVIDYNVKVRVKPDQSGVDLANEATLADLVNQGDGHLTGHIDQLRKLAATL